jgi:hypothetical protein
MSSSKLFYGEVQSKIVDMYNNLKLDYVNNFKYNISMWQASMDVEWNFPK